MSSITTAQTIGPFPHEGWQWAVDATHAGTSGSTVVLLRGAVLDGAGAPVDDAMLEAFSPAAAAGETHEPLPGFRRAPSDARGEFTFRLPRPAPGAPLAWVTLFARGVVKHQHCAVFLDDDPALAQSPLLAQVPAERRDTLLARRADDGSYRWEVRLQGAQETVFFDYA